MEKWISFYSRFGPVREFEEAGVSLKRLLRLSLFNITVGLAQVLFYGTLNRVMIIEMHVPATIVSIFIAIPVLVAPFRALIGFKSDTHRSVLGWRRVPYIWGGTLLQWSGLAFMPFALILLTGDQHWGPPWLGWMFGGLSFLLVGAGAHTVQTAGLALATDLATEKLRPKVVALMYLMLLIGMTLCSVVVSALLVGYTPIKLIKVIQGTALVSLFVNMAALWKQEARNPAMKPYRPGERQPIFMDTWLKFLDGGPAVRLLVAAGLGFFAFNLQDVLLEPFGGEILHLSVSQTTWLTGVFTLGSLTALALSSPILHRGLDPIKLAGLGVLIGMLGFAGVIISAPTGSKLAFQAGTFVIGFGEVFFGVGTLSFAMGIKDASQHGIALGAWGAVFATGEGIALALSGALRDWVTHLIRTGRFTGSLANPAFPYVFVYYLEIASLVFTAIALLPLLRRRGARPEPQAGTLELVEYLA